VNVLNSTYKAQASPIIESLGMNRLNDILPLYMKVRGQIEVQLQVAQEDGNNKHTKE
jgi:hypothetical protein